jgi:uncharacterized protein
MIECPWCTETVEIIDDICPNCRHEVLLDRDGNLRFDEPAASVHEHDSEESIGQLITDKFKCVKCSNRECDVKEVAMTGTGLSKILDVQHNHYLFVSCLQCGYVEVFNPDILTGKKSGALVSIIDLVFGG